MLKRLGITSLVTLAFTAAVTQWDEFQHRRTSCLQKGIILNTHKSPSHIKCGYSCCHEKWQLCTSPIALKSGNAKIYVTLHTVCLSRRRCLAWPEILSSPFNDILHYCILYTGSPIIWTSVSRGMHVPLPATAEKVKAFSGSMLSRAHPGLSASVAGAPLEQVRLHGWWGWVEQGGDVMKLCGECNWSREAMRGMDLAVMMVHQ